MPAPLVRSRASTSAIGDAVQFAVLDGRTFVFLPYDEWGRTRIYEIDAEGVATERGDTVGDVFKCPRSVEVAQSTRSPRGCPLRPTPCRLQPVAATDGALVHRYVGLAIAVFLLVAGLTGSLLAFYAELDRVFSSGPSSSRAAVAGCSCSNRSSSPNVSRRLCQVRLPGSTSSKDRSTHSAYGPKLQTMSGEKLSSILTPVACWVRGPGQTCPEGVVNLMPFLYRLHYSLAWATWEFCSSVSWLCSGPVGLLRRCLFDVSSLGPPRGQHGAIFLVSALVASVAFADQPAVFVPLHLHRASGLWLWALLLVFAWSAVGLNLPQVHRPVMSVLA